MEPFTLTCTTCQARLKIVDASAIGQIHACPRCGGMVKIAAPATGGASSKSPAAGDPETKPTAVVSALTGTLSPSASDATPASAAAPRSLRDIAADASSAATETTTAPQTPDSPGSFLHDPRIAWVCIPLAAILTGFIIWPASEPTPSTGAANVTQVASVDDKADVATQPTPAPADATPANPAASSVTDGDAPKTPALPPLVKPPIAKSPSDSSVADSSQPPTGTTPPIKPVEPAAKLPEKTATPAPNPPIAGKLAPSKVPDESIAAKGVPPAAQPNATSGEVVELPKLDFTAALQSEFERIEFTDVALCDWLRFVGRAANLPITLDADQMVDLGSKLDQPLSIKKYNLTVQELLKTVLGEIGLDYAVEDYQVLVIAAGQVPTDLISEKHSTSAFTVETAEQLGDLIRLLIDPASWVDADGRGTLKVEGRDLVIQQTPAVQRQVRQLLKGLAQLRDKKFSQQPRFRRAEAKLATPVRINFPGPTPLLQVIEHLRKQYGLITLVDYAALAAEQKTAQVTVSLVVHDEPLGDALQTLLEPHGLVVRVVDTNAVEITTAAGAERRADLEFYPLGKLLVAGEPIDAVLQRVKEQLPGVTWRETGGVGTLAIDSATGMLIVRHSQAVQRRVADWIARSAK